MLVSFVFNGVTCSDFKLSTHLKPTINDGCIDLPIAFANTIRDMVEI